ncbi:MAG: excinuclease ABC subunit UvrA, partial [Syntrophothermus sp.]
MPVHDFIRITNATANNLKSLSVSIPRNKLTVVSGVSGSGKSTLIFDVLYQEAGNRFLGSFSSGARHFFGKMKQSEVEKIEGLSPALTVDQRTARDNPRSTAGTMTGIYDYLRLLYARTGKADPASRVQEINRNLFSFNSPAGACPLCKGLGVEDYLDPELLVADETKSIRDRALVITAPNGYIIYSQVTMEVMDQICRAEGFSVDIPWKDLTPDQKNIILYGSDKIEIPFGKHTLESRMKWTGITAKPRETGYYKGIIPIMENILRRDRNKNILRFVRTVPCPACQGKRLNKNALSVTIDGRNIWDLSSLEFDDLERELNKIHFDPQEQTIAKPILNKLFSLTKQLHELGLGYLTCTRDSGTLSGGETQRLRLAVQTRTGLTGITYLFDEPSIGLHPSETMRLINVLKDLRDKGNTVIVIEHDDLFIRHADWLVDIGPGAGIYGGELIWSGAVADIPHLPAEKIHASRTLSFLTGLEKNDIRHEIRENPEWLIVEGASANNLKDITVQFMLGGLNVITGVSGAGKSSLAEEVVGKALKRRLNGSNDIPGKFKTILHAEKLSGVITIDQSPIGRTPRSNPATYTGLSDSLRDLFADLPESKRKGFTRSHFSFNTEGGRCENCQGAGYIQTGMHFMGDVEIPCEVCEGKRFKDEILEIRWRGKNMFDVLDMFISEALDFFSDQPKILAFLKVMNDLGLGYLKPGQRSTTLSGGEAQRIKLATELVRKASKTTLYILDEPTTGLHHADVGRLIGALLNLTRQGHTVIVTEHHSSVIAVADHIVELGPGSGKLGGFVVETKINDPVDPARIVPLTGSEQNFAGDNDIHLVGISTNNLKNINADIPKNKMTVITGVSGSGKSSLAFDTLHAEGKNRFMESFSAYIRTRIGMEQGADAEEISGLTPTLAIDQKNRAATARSTVGTMTGIYDLYRLLYARVGISQKIASPVLSSLFSFNHHHGACEKCDGIGYLTLASEEKLITHPEKSLLQGALDRSKTGKFYGDPFGQYTATLKAAGKLHSVDFNFPWNQLSAEARKIAMKGTGDEIYDVTWEYRRGERTGSHHFKGKWIGFLGLVNEEYARKHADHRGEEMMGLMEKQLCPECRGKRLNPDACSFTIGGKDIAELSNGQIKDNLEFFNQLDTLLQDSSRVAIASDLKVEIIKKLKILMNLGLPYLAVSRTLSSLSGGEFQRVKLGALLGSGLTGITYIPDEPTLGLHPSDTEKLIQTLRSLQENGNTLVIVEHDREVILAADHIIDMGPGAGKEGGKVLATGSVNAIMNDPESVTGPFLLKKYHFKEPSGSASGDGIVIRGANAHNHKNIDINFPEKGITVISGVSGSGKSTLIFD